jgi:hypothetical protein
VLQIIKTIYQCDYDLLFTSPSTCGGHFSAAYFLEKNSVYVTKNTEHLVNENIMLPIKMIVTPMKQVFIAIMISLFGGVMAEDNQKNR